MSLRMKVFLAIVATMLITTTIVTLNLVYQALAQHQHYTHAFETSHERIVDQWVATALPDDLEPEELLNRLDLYERKFFPRAADGNAGENSMFSEMVLIDKYRYVERVLTDNEARRTELIPGGARKKLYDEALLDVLQTGEPQIRDNVVYRPLTRTVESPLPGREPREEVAYVLKVGLDLDLPSPISPRELMGSVLPIMFMGTVVLVLVVFVLLSRMVLRPLEQLVSASRSIASGDYEWNVQMTSPPDSHDEIGTLVSTFDQMMREVRDHRTDLEDKVEDALKQHRRAEQALIIAQRLAATGTLAAGIAHEINNPLQGMQNAVRRLEKRLGDNLDARNADYLALVREGLQRIQEIVKQVLDVSRRSVNPAPFDMSEPVERAVALVEHKASREATEIEVTPPEEEGVLCFGDRGEINQVLTNLLINGVDAIRDARYADEVAGTEARTGKIEVRWQPVEEGIEVVVRDNGIGMDESHSSRAFDAFYTTKQDGTGLGLSIIHNIIDSHGGIIRLDSAPGQGTTVTFTIPKHLEE